MSEQGQANSENLEGFGYSATLSRGQKGTYGWEVKAKLATMQAVLDAVEAMDTALKAKYEFKPSETTAI